MDPLSISSGIAGLLSFAAGLAELSVKLKHAVDQFKSAPSQIEELGQKLEILETVCNLIEPILRKRQKQLTNLALNAEQEFIAVVSTALAQCHMKMEALEQTLATVRVVSGPTISAKETRKSRLQAEIKSRVRFVYKTDRIRSMAQQVDEVISLLHFVINVDMWSCLTLVTSNDISTPEKWTSNTSALAHQRHTNPIMSADQETFLTAPMSGRPCQRAVKKYRLSLLNLGTVTWETLQDLQHADDNEDHMNWVGRTPAQKIIINFRLPFTSSQVNFQYMYGAGSPSYAMVITHIVEPGSELDQRIKDIMFETQDIADINELFSAKLLSLYSHSRDCNLFNIALSAGWAAGCRYLLYHDFRRTFLAIDTFCNQYNFTQYNCITPGGVCDTTELLLAQRTDGSHTKDLQLLLGKFVDLTFLYTYVPRFLALCPNAVDQAELIRHAWNAFVSVMSSAIRNYYDRDTSWDRETIHLWCHVAQTLINAGADVHDGGDGFCHSDSPYLMILNSTCTPLQADDYLCYWLNILENSGVSIRPYIEREKKNAVLEFVTYPGRRLTTITYRGNILVPSWQWVKDPTSPAFTLLDTFEFLRGYRQENRPAPKERCIIMQQPDPEWESFPFYFRCYYYSRIKNEDANCRSFKTAEQGWELREQRFARRMEKKRRKQCKGRRGEVFSSGAEDMFKMPGSWVD